MILVTGGAGFIGSNFVLDWIAATGEPVVNLDKLTYAGNLANLASLARDARHVFVRGDIGDRALVEKLLAEHRPRAIVHFAAESHVDRSIHGPGDFVKTNVVGTFELLEAARGYWHGLPGEARDQFRFLHVSTDEVYGSIPEGSWTEDWPLRPNSPYSASKAGSDLLALAAHRTHGMDVVVTRCSNNYGPYQFPEKVIPLFVTNLLDGRKVPLYGDGGNIRDWLHVDDHCLGIQLALDKGRAGEIYHIGGGTELTNRELTERLLAACGADWSSVEYVTDRKGHDRRYSLSIAKISEELGYEPQVTLEAGLASTVEWYRAHRTWWEPLRARAALAG
jgi:dTDP-glucose 4,6-dehydratase